jgi:hypothetical protein
MLRNGSKSQRNVPARSPRDNAGTIRNDILELQEGCRASAGTDEGGNSGTTRLSEIHQVSWEGYSGRLISLDHRPSVRLTIPTDRHLVIEHVPKKTNFSLKKFPYDRHLPNIKFVMIKPLEPTRYLRETYNGSWETSVKCSLIIFASACYTTLATVLESSQAASDFFSDVKTRTRLYALPDHGHGAYIPERIGFLTLKSGAVLSGSAIEKTSGIDYGYLFDRHELDISIDETDTDDYAVLQTTIVQLLRLEHSIHTDPETIWPINVQCFSRSLPTVLSAVSPIMSPTVCGAHPY